MSTHPPIDPELSAALAVMSDDSQPRLTLDNIPALRAQRLEARAEVPADVGDAEP